MKLHNPFGRKANESVVVSASLVLIILVSFMILAMPKTLLFIFLGITLIFSFLYPLYLVLKYIFTGK